MNNSELHYVQWIVENHREIAEMNRMITIQQWLLSNFLSSE